MPPEIRSNTNKKSIRKSPVNVANNKKVAGYKKTNTAAGFDEFKYGKIRGVRMHFDSAHFAEITKG